MARTSARKQKQLEKKQSIRILDFRLLHFIAINHKNGPEYENGFCPTAIWVQMGSPEWAEWFGPHKIIVRQNTVEKAIHKPKEAFPLTTFLLG